MTKRVSVLFLLLLTLSTTAAAVPASAATDPRQDVRAAQATVERALAAASAGDLNTAKSAYGEYENTWFDIEDGVRATSRDAYVAIEKDMTAVTAALSATPPDQTQVVQALSSLDQEQA